MNSRVHSNQETKYCDANWARHDRSLETLSELTFRIAPGTIQTWVVEPQGRRAAPQKYPDIAIATARTINSLSSYRCVG